MSKVKVFETSLFILIFLLSFSSDTHTSILVTIISGSMAIYFIIKYDGDDQEYYPDGIFECMQLDLVVSIINNISDGLSIGDEVSLKNASFDLQFVCKHLAYIQERTEDRIGRLYGGDLK